MRVDCHDKYAFIGDFSIPDNTLTVYKRSSAPNLESPIRGHYARLDGNLAVLYRVDDSLKFHFNDMTAVLNSDAEVSWHSIDRKWHLRRNKVRFTIRAVTPMDINYRSNLRMIEEQVSWTPNSSREDWDFGLFVTNVFNDPERRNRIYT
jgi:hypothetical protein